MNTNRTAASTKFALRYIINIGAEGIYLTDRKVRLKFDMTAANEDELSAVAANISREKGLK
jgi:hypothetical protein